MPVDEQPNVLAAPDWFPDSLDTRRGELAFVSTDRGTLSSQTFLDWRWTNGRGAQTRRNATALLAQLPPGERLPPMIWHTGFCCSTLLAKALDMPARNLSLCEPQILVHLANGERAGHISQEQIPAVSKLVFHLLARRFSPAERVTLKPAPGANRLLRQVPKQDSGPMLFLYSDCRSFLLSVCKLGEDGRRYVRRLFLSIVGDGHAPARWPADRLLALSDLELAALVWHLQIAEFLRSWATLAPGHAASLDCDALLRSPADTLQRLAGFFSLDLGPQEIAEIVGGPLFRRNAKTGESEFNAARRAEEHARIAHDLGPNLSRIVASSYALSSDTPRSAPLPQPLMGIEKKYDS